MKYWAVLGLLLLAGCASLSPSTSGVAGVDSPASTKMPAATQKAPTPAEAISTPAKKADLPNLGPAPELTNEVWLNTDKPLRLADLHGKVVLLDMWTFGCINCRHVIPSLRGWYEKYGAEGLVVIGNHYPEFSYERDRDNVKQALVDLNVPYPVAQDNDGKTWRAYNNHYWPSLYLIDKQGNIRYTHIGEGNYSQTETAIQALLNEPNPEKAGG